MIYSSLGYDKGHIVTRDRHDAGRRRFLGGAALAAAWAAGRCLAPVPVRAFSGMRPAPSQPPAGCFALAQMRYAGDWDPEPAAPATLLEALARNTSVDPGAERVVLGLGDDAIFSVPFLWVAGRGDFPVLTAVEIARLRAWLDAGGTLVADDGTGVPGSPFDTGVRRELARVYPDAPIARLPAEHTVFKSFFLIRSVAGRVAASPFLEGLSLRGRTCVILSPNDLFGAWARDRGGGWVHECRPGGDRQRRASLHLGINIVLYALSGDYKQDRIHEPFIRRRS